MICTAFFLMAAAFLFSGGAPWATSASGDDGRVSVTISVHERTVAPGEVARIGASSKMLVDGPLRFPQNYHQPLAFLYLRTPGGKVIVYPEGGVSPKSCRALELGDYNYASLREKGAGYHVLAKDIVLVNASPEWLDPETFKPVRANLRAEGVYEAWVRYIIPKLAGLPADTWHGTIETKPIRFTVREIPVVDRRAKATAEQIAHLDAYMKYMDDLLSGKDVKTPRPKTVEMPEWLSLDDRLQWALERTENEGFARYTVALLRKHQPKNKDEPYPEWWANVSFYVYGRAYSDHPYGGRALKVIGPYLDDYAEVAVRELELALAGHTNRGPGLSMYRYDGMLLDFLKHKPHSPIRERLEILCRQHAKMPAEIKRRDRLGFEDRLTVSWTLLFGLGILRDGMPFAEAKKILGEPATRKGNRVDWFYETGARGIGPFITGRIVLHGNHETVVFINSDDWE